MITPTIETAAAATHTSSGELSFDQRWAAWKAKGLTRSRSMPSDALYESEYRRAMLVITREQSAALNAHSKALRLQAVDTIQRSRQLREQCAALSARIAAALRGHSRL